MHKHLKHLSVSVFHHQINGCLYPLKKIIESNSPFSMLLDESTSLSRRSCLIVNIRTMIEGKSFTFHLDLIELQSSFACGIIHALLTSLKHSGMTNEYLSIHWLGLATDGCSTMLSRKGGLTALLLAEYPRLIVWHCMAHRLELAVNY